MQGFFSIKRERFRGFLKTESILLYIYTVLWKKNSVGIA